MQYDKEHDPIFVRNLFGSKYDEWRVTRPELSPAVSPAKVSLSQF